MSSAMTLTDVPNKDSNTDPETKYEVLEVLGEGVFGTVTKCRNRATNEIVALKVIKKDKKMYLNFKRELEMLEHISSLDPDVFNLVKFIESFDFQDRQSMVFEMLDISVYDLMLEEYPFSLSQARPVAKQLLIALQGLQDVGVIHSDIKPDNIMLVNHREQPFKVKLIDFGVAKRSDQVYPGQAMQPPFVRAPEVTLGLPLWEAVDMWSLACCLLLFCYETAEEFAGYSNFDNMTKLAHFLGKPAKELLDEALYAEKYFVSENNNWRLKTLQEFKESTGEDPDMSDEQRSASSLEELIKTSREFVSEQESHDRDAFYNLLSKMLEINAEKRITPAQALLHPFITMDHLPKGDNYTKEAHELMRVAETTYGPLQRESLEKIAEKQKKEALAANDFTGCADDGSTSISSFVGADESTGSPGTSGDVVPLNNKTTDARDQKTSPGEIGSHFITFESAGTETTQSVSKGEADDDEESDNGTGLKVVKEELPAEFAEILEDIETLFQEAEVREEANDNCKTTQTESEADDADIQENYLEEADDDEESDNGTVLEVVKKELSAEYSDILEDIETLFLDAVITEDHVSQKASKSTFSRLLPRPLRVLFSRLSKLLQRRGNKPFFTKPKWIQRISGFTRRSTASGPSKH